MKDRDPRHERIRRLRGAIATDEQCLLVTEQQQDPREVARLRKDLENRRAYLAELLAQQGSE
jgi:hypothetical protein